jgi:hypothetical protein
MLMISFKKFRGKLLTALMAAVMMLSAAGAAFAATSDPYLGSYQLEDYNNPWGTFVVENKETDVGFYISPKIIQDFNTPPTSFDNAIDAAGVKFNVILDTPPSISSANVTITPYDVTGNGDWMALVDVELPSDGSFGSLSIEFTNPGAPGPDNYTNVTIVRQEEEPWEYTTVNGIEARIYDPASTAFYGAVNMTVDYIDFYETPLRSFPTALDGLFHAYLYGGIRDNVSNITMYPTIVGLGDYVYSMTIDGTLYPDQSGRIGWQYRVYDSRRNMIPLTEYVGSDSFKLLTGDIVVWKYGLYGDSTLFPNPLP